MWNLQLSTVRTQAIEENHLQEVHFQQTALFTKMIIPGRKCSLRAFLQSRPGQDSLECNFSFCIARALLYISFGWLSFHSGPELRVWNFWVSLYTNSGQPLKYAKTTNSWGFSIYDVCSYNAKLCSLLLSLQTQQNFFIFFYLYCKNTMDSGEQ